MLTRLCSLGRNAVRHHRTTTYNSACVMRQQRQLNNYAIARAFSSQQGNNDPKDARCEHQQQQQQQGDKYREKFEEVRQKVDADKGATSGKVSFEHYKSVLNEKLQQVSERLKASTTSDASSNTTTTTNNNATTNNNTDKTSSQSQQSANNGKGTATAGAQQKVETYNSEDIVKARVDLEDGAQKSTDGGNDGAPSNSVFAKVKENPVAKFCLEAWQMTFPDEALKARQKMERVREAARKQKEEEERLRALNYTEEELEGIQQAIPEWKRTSLQATSEAKVQKKTLREKLADKIKEKVNETEVAKQLYQSEGYKEYTEFKKDLTQFKEDAKDYIHNSPSNLVQGSLYVYSRASNENETARAIREMRKYDPEFDLWELESEAREIFKTVYTMYLKGDLKNLEKVCGEQALGYFKVLLKKNEADKCVPKYKELWTIDKAQFSKAAIPEINLPMFQFLINAQQIHCMVSHADERKIVDGSDDRLISMQYQFSLRLHQSPDIESMGHKWEVVDLQPREIVKMLV